MYIPMKYQEDQKIAPYPYPYLYPYLFMFSSIYVYDTIISSSLLLLLLLLLLLILNISSLTPAVINTIFIFHLPYFHWLYNSCYCLC